MARTRVSRVAEFLAGNKQSFLNLGMAAAKSSADPCRVPGTGQIGAGTVRAPLACFERALDAFAAPRPAR